MSFVVTHAVEKGEAPFAAYARLLRQRGENLSDLPRVEDPSEPGRRWVRAWTTEEEAARFADELKAETGDDAWCVVSTSLSPSNGPFGPLPIHLTRSSDRLTFALHPLSRAVIHGVYPDALPVATTTAIGGEEWRDFRARATLADLVLNLAPALTGLDMAQLNDLGYALMDADTERTCVYVPPASLCNEGASPGAGANGSAFSKAIGLVTPGTAECESRP